MANLPEQVQTLINQYLEQVRTDPEYSLSGEDRGHIYKSFGRSRFTHRKYYFDFDNDEDWVKPTSEPSKRKPNNKPLQKIQKALAKQTIGDYALGWLAILTAKHVLPIWENTVVSISEYETTPKELIEQAEQILRGSWDIGRALRDLNENYYYGENLGNFTNFDLASVYVSAISAFRVAMLGADNLDKFNPAMAEAKITLSGDCILQAARAYTVTDKNKPGKWQDFEGRTAKALEIGFDKNKRLEFWEWWLTEAIPQAWELAQASTTTK